VYGLDIGRGVGPTGGQRHLLVPLHLSNTNMHAFWPQMINTFTFQVRLSRIYTSASALSAVLSAFSS
jgi:hypothetical protein